MHCFLEKCQKLGPCSQLDFRSSVTTKLLRFDYNGPEAADISNEEIENIEEVAVIPGINDNKHYVSSTSNVIGDALFVISTLPIVVLSAIFISN